jgi:FAD/FMN-containing dehydrogenase
MKGQMELEYEGERTIVKENEAVLLDFRRPHAYRAASDTLEKWEMLFDGNASEAFYRQIAGEGGQTFKVTGKLHRTLEKLMDELDVVVPVDQFAPYVLFVREQGEKYGLTVRNFGHAGDGNLHIYTCSNDKTLDEFWAANNALMDACYDECKRIGGNMSGEHGVGHGKVKYLQESVGEIAYGLMKGIKNVFDPNGILNPGKVVV